ncbi:hypothetical protein BZL30_1936 [Mycobacterium kansasii]|uniref:DUF222 domain-containing protein n=1 Tax=Mycobacterium kansasii TaxID=1768 RepID=A0A1V3XJF4_MYCKA|nr:hypothetical protein BZL30_1936 [Mycobacterium kansasii]
MFDKGKALALYHSKRLAAPGQRIVLYARDRGCSASGCDVTGYFCEVHHVVPYAQSPTTDVNQLTFACSGHHPPADKGWTTRKNTTATANGHPTHLDRGQPAPTCTTPENSSAQTKTRMLRNPRNRATGEAMPSGRVTYGKTVVRQGSRRSLGGSQPAQQSGAPPATR